MIRTVAEADHTSSASLASALDTWTDTTLDEFDDMDGEQRRRGLTLNAA